MLLFLIEKHKLFKETARRSSEGKDSRQVVIRLHVRTLSCFSHVQLFVTLCTAAHQAPLSMGFSGKNTGVDCHALLWGSSGPRDQPQVSYCLLDWQVGSLLPVPLGKPSGA